MVTGNSDIGRAFDDMEGDILSFSDLDLARLGSTRPERSAPDPPILSQAECTSNERDQLLLDPTASQSPRQENVRTDHFPNWVKRTTQDLLPSLPAHTSTGFPQPWQPLPSLSQADMSPDTLLFQHPTSAPQRQQPRLPRRKSRYLRQREQQEHNVTQPIKISRPNFHASSHDTSPLRRWENSPPEAEAASLSDIADALRSTALRSRSSQSYRSGRMRSRPSSTTSLGSMTSMSSNSTASTHSAACQSYKSPSRGRVPKGSRAPAKRVKPAGDRVFPCTFCCDSFKTKFDWARHERSRHLNLQGWCCATSSGIFVSSDAKLCAYCGQLDPTPNHLDGHNHWACQVAGQRNVFSRKDHLLQHLRLVHNVQNAPNLDAWRVEGPQIKSRCGICDCRLDDWQERVDHLSAHFRQGLTMDDWKGEHEFEREIAVRVTNAMPPYLLGAESRAPVPFSATDPGTRDHLSQIQRMTAQPLDLGDDSPDSTFASDNRDSPDSVTQARDTIQESSSITFPELLAIHLSRFARQQLSRGLLPTDAMFQEEARRITYNSGDPWDQTIAENADWLSAFRNRYLGNSDLNS